MTTLEQVLENLKILVGKEYKNEEGEIELNQAQELANDIICAFEDFESNLDLNNEIIFGDDIMLGGDEQVWQCYVNSKDATVISVQVEELYNDDGFLVGYKVIDVWA